MAHYWAHRWWHWSLKKDYLNPAVEGERLHHIYYDDQKQHLDPEHKDGHWIFISFDKFWPLITFFAMSFIISSCHHWVYGSIWFLSVMISMFIDDIVHRTIHIAHQVDLDPVYKLKLNYLAKYHLIHHNTHRFNFAFCTGVLWDRVFGTFCSPLSPKNS